MKALGILQRLAGQAVDRERQALQAILAEIDDVETQIETWRRNLADEAAAPTANSIDDSTDVMASRTTLFAYLESGRARVQALQATLAELRKAESEQLARLSKERVEEKRFERIAERRARQAALEAAAREQKIIDEMAILRRTDPSRRERF